MEITKYANITSNKDCSITYVNNDGIPINIYQELEGGYEVSSKSGTMYIEDLGDEDQFISIMEFMIQADKNLLVSKKILSNI